MISTAVQARGGTQTGRRTKRGAPPLPVLATIIIRHLGYPWCPQNHRPVILARFVTPRQTGTSPQPAGFADQAF